MYAKEMDLTLNQVSERIAYDPQTGIFTWLISPNRRTKVGSVAGGKGKSARRNNKTGVITGYKYINVLHQQTPAARVAWLLTYGEWPKGNILFKDNDPSNLRIDNLKEGNFPSVRSVKEGRRHYKMSHEAQRHYGLRKYGLSLETYNVMLAAQNGVCAICKNPETGKTPYGKDLKPLSVDHNHETNEVRGLLCTQCNYMIGHCQEDREVLLAGVAYLDKYAGVKQVTPTLTVVSNEESH
jgi:hypothetical protein